MLENEVEFPLGNEIAVIGLGDLYANKCLPAKVFSKIKHKNTINIVLEHNPDGAEILKNFKVDLQLSGHTQ